MPPSAVRTSTSIVCCSARVPPGDAEQRATSIAGPLPDGVTVRTHDVQSFTTAIEPVRVPGVLVEDVPDSFEERRRLRERDGLRLEMQGRVNVDGGP
jgi:hypothetical protein